MPQARGAQTKLLLQRETTYRTAPGAAAAKVIPFTTWGVGRDPRRQSNPSIDGNALPSKRDSGDPRISGPFTSVLDLRSIGNWLALLLGVPTTGKAVTVQPTNVTGVIVNYAESGCPNGNGTLTFTASGTTLTWAAQGESAGAAVNVGAGGNFTLQSSVANHSINVWVGASALPGGNQSDNTIAVSSTLKAHSFPVNNTDRPSALLELGHSDIGKYYRCLGAKLSRLSWDLLSNEQNIAGEIMAAVETEGGSAWDGAPTTYTQFRACSAGGRVYDGTGASLGAIVGATIQFDNQMVGYELADATEGYGYIDQGDLLITGRLRVLFDGATAYALSRANTSTRMRLVTQATQGAATYSLAVDLPHVELTEPRRTIDGKAGLFVDVDWAAHSGALNPTIVLINDVTGY